MRRNRRNDQILVIFSIVVLGAFGTVILGTFGTAGTTILGAFGTAIFGAFGTAGTAIFGTFGIAIFGTFGTAIWSAFGTAIWGVFGIAIWGAFGTAIWGVFGAAIWGVFGTANWSVFGAAVLGAFGTATLLMTRYIFITGGVTSSLGKGLAMASLGALLQARGFRIRLRKLDPYLNIDPGTMSPYQHGEVYVTEDGAETDLDLGHYERFVDIETCRDDSITAGRIYLDLLTRERRGDFLGGTVQVIPHVTDAIKAAITKDNADYDFVLCEIGGTVGDIEGLPFFEAIRQLGNERGPHGCVFVHVTLVPYIESAGEIKTKPTQHSVKELRSIGIRANILLCRSKCLIAPEDRAKIALFCDVSEADVISGRDVASIYQAPLTYHEQGFDRRVLACFGIDTAPEPDLSPWRNLATLRARRAHRVVLAVVGKYTGFQDAYKSLIEALDHSALANDTTADLNWIDSSDLEAGDDEKLRHVDGILIPGGFGSRGFDGKMAACRFARTHAVPFFGLCLGMQAAVVEYARNVVGLTEAGSTEFDQTCMPVVGMMTEWNKDQQRALRNPDDPIGGTMRLGAYPAVLADNSHIAAIYTSSQISERHRHRYEVNKEYCKILERHGLSFSGFSPDYRLPETIEISDHPWYIGVQFHPEMKSRPLNPHPLFTSFIAATLKHAQQKHDLPSMA